MATGGRVLNHLKAALPNARNTILFSGFQAEGTRGRKLIDGLREIKIHGEMVQVNARIEQLQSMSAHADAGELLRWLRGFRKPPAMTYVVHGEPAAADALAASVQATLGWKAHVAEYLEAVELAS
jgi:metallo-beta-lactamase family protein